jgi:hypothetical protein
MGKIWVLDTETKGTGAHVAPLEKVVKDPASEDKPAFRPPGRRAPAPPPSRPRKRPAETSSSPLPPGHVRKKTTGELGRVRSVDAKAGTASVLWLRQGRTSTVPLSAISRR